MDAVAKQCPELVDDLNSLYGIELSGEDILNILCEQNCTRATGKENKGMFCHVLFIQHRAVQGLFFIFYTH